MHLFSLRDYLKIFILLLVMMSGPRASAGTPTVYQQLCALNNEWCTKDLTDPILDSRISLSTDVELITTHLQLVETELRSRNVDHLSKEVQAARLRNLDLLKEYWEAGVFPINLYHNEPTPYFIDDFGTACAVGYLVIGTGSEEFAQTIKKENNYAYIYNLNEKYAGLETWANANGFTLAELAWIQPIYCSNPCPAGTQFNVSCNGACDGCAQPDPAGAGMVAPYTYVWDDPSGAGCNLCAGTWNCTVTDFLSAVQVFTFTITEPPPLVASVSSSGNVDCNGNCTGFAQSSVTGGTAPYNYLWSDGQTGSLAVNLCAGTYCVTVTDQNGCTATSCVTITEPPPLTLVLSSADESCPGSCDGSVNLSVSGGTTPYAYLWSNSSTSSTIGPLCTGTYCVTVTDAAGCTVASCDTVESGPGPVIDSIVVVSDNCSPCADSLIGYQGFGGSGPYTYTWLDNNLTVIGNSSVITNVCSGTYYFQIGDVSGCIASQSVVLTNTSLLNVSTTSVDANCGQPDGSACVSVTGGTTPYTYLWDDPGAQTDTCATGLPAGCYTVTVTSNNGCSNTATVCLNDLAGGVATTAVMSNATCLGVCDGQANVSMSGATPPFTYSWNTTPVQTSATADSLCSGTYDVTVTDSIGCLSFASVIITETAPLSLSIIGVGNVSCFGGNDGYATVNVTPGTAPFSYLWNDPANQATPTAANLSFGTYCVTVIDSTGCTNTICVTITEPAPIIVNPSAVNPLCFGDCDGMAGVTVVGGTAPYAYIWNDPLNQTNATATGLCAGVYTVVITDNNGCIETFTIALTNPTPISATATSTGASCFGTCDGTATVTVSNGTPPYSYLWNDPLNQPTNPATGLCAGVYMVTITDSNGCMDMATVTVTEPLALVASISTYGNVDCNGNCTGFAQVSVTGGTAPYSYLWSDGQTGPQAVNLCAGTYCVTITDQNGCLATACVTITEPPPLIVTTTPVDVTCNGACDGSAAVSVSGGTAPYTYLWDDVNFQTTPTATNLCAGIYTVIVADSNGCVITNTVTIIQPQILGMSATVTSSTCSQANGSACVIVIGGVSPYVIQWDDPNTTVGACVFNVFAGVYNPIVVDANGCFYTMPVIINDLPGPVIDSIVTTDETCAGDCNGTATVYATGISPPLTYIWNNLLGDTIAVGVTTVFNLCTGTYTVVTTDANSCTTGGIATINGPSPLLTAITSSIDASCNGICDGSATVSVAGGTTPYTYLWTNGCTTPTCGNLCAGTHTAVVTDANGCVTIDTILISEPAPLVMTGVVTDVSCFGGNNGAISINVTGGTPFYTYQWVPGGMGTNLSAQVYTITVTDINGCTVTETYTISEPSPMTVGGSTLPSTCGEANGMATVTATGGISPYTYLWNDSLAQTTQTAIGLAAGSYEVTVTDNNGCFIVLAVIVVGNQGPTLDSLSKTDIMCNGDCNGSVSAFTSGGTAPFTYTWDDGQNTPTASALCAGIYGVTVTDLNGCTASNSIAILEPAPMVLTTSPDLLVCIGETVTISAMASGGTLSYNIIWDNGLGNGSIKMVSITQDTAFTVMAIDANLCESDSQTISISIGAPLAAVASGASTICIGDSTIVSATGSGGFTPYTYEWGNGGSSGATFWATPVADTTYSVSITDSCGAVASDSIAVTVVICGLAIPESTVQSSMRIYPNPGTGQFNITFDLVERQRVKIHVYSVTGQIMFEQQSIRAGGVQMQSIDLNGLAPGLYNLRIELESEMVNRRLVIR